MTQLKENGTTLFPALTDFFETDSWIAPGKFIRNFTRNLPAANISETENLYRIELAVPGFKKEEVKVSLDHDVLTVSGENRKEQEEQDKQFTRREFSSNSFTRSFQLPDIADSEKIDARYEDGILKVEVKKKAEALKKPTRKIEIS